VNRAASDAARDALRTLWRIRNPWDRRLRLIVRELIRSDIRTIRAAGSRR